MIYKTLYRKLKIDQHEHHKQSLMRAFISVTSSCSTKLIIGFKV
jgi:hypothetical protein